MCPRNHPMSGYTGPERTQQPVLEHEADTSIWGAGWEKRSSSIPGESRDGRLQARRDA